MKKKEFNVNPFVLIFCVVFVCGILCFLIPPGELENGVYTSLPRNELSFDNIFNIFRAFPQGIKGTINIIILILVVGGALEIYKKTGAIDNGISVLIQKFGKNAQSLLLFVLIITFFVIGGFLGWIEAMIPFAPLLVAVVLALGYDSIVAAAIIIVGLIGGFTAGPTNLYTVAICNGILQQMGILAEDADMFTGMGFRVVLWCILTLVSTIYIMRYAAKIKKDPQKSLMADVDVSDLKIDTSIVDAAKLTGRQIIVLLLILAAMIMTIIGMKFGIDGTIWSIDDISAVFILSCIAAGLVGKLKPADIANAFVAGAKGSVGGALIVGLARGVYWILDTMNIVDTMVYNGTNLLMGTSPYVSAIGIILIVSVINFFIPSGSAKASLLSPIMVPIALSLGLQPQTAVLAYQFGDGITNMLYFTYGTLIIFLNYGKVSIQKWWKFFIPLMLIFFGIAFVAVTVAVSIGY